MPLYYLTRKKKNACKENKVGRESKSRLVNKLDRVFSLYIRLRDVMPNGYVRCISCGKIKKFEDVDCGHFHSRRHMSTRYDEDNCSAECRYCNRFSADHLIGYQLNLIKKIGEKRFELLNVKAHTTYHYCDNELGSKIAFYNSEVKKLSTLKGIKVNI